MSLERLDSSNSLQAMSSEGANPPSRSVGEALKRAAIKTGDFIKNHWQELLAYIFACGVIITCAGLMYGFEAVALPLTIGLAGGLGFGIITGAFTVNTCDPEGNLTLWNGINHVINQLDANGMRQIVLSIAVTVLLATAVVFPYVLGAAFGILLGNQLAVKIATEDAHKPPPDPTAAQLQTQIDTLTARVNDLEQQGK